MSYLVLARKWRPKRFAETVGQEHVLKALVNALETGRLHHAYLFAGTRGVGKTTIARILAKALNCEQGIVADPCGVCSACREIDEGRFVDLIEVDAASRTKVDDTRDLLDNVQYSPARGRFKVYLIDEVHMLSRNSFNALLKTLEEPPPHVKFLLATTDPQKLPVTVLSRCLQFNLKRLTPQLIRNRLQHICEVEEVPAEPAALATLARAADGSLRDALSLLDQAIAYCGGNLAETAVAAMLGTIERQYVHRLLAALKDNDAQALLAIVAELDEQFPDYGTLLADLATLLQRIAVWQAIGAVDTLDEVDQDTVRALAESLATEDVQLYYQIAVTGRRDLALAPDPRSGAEMTLLRMLAFRPDDGVLDPADRAARPQPVPARRAQKEPAGKPAAAVERKMPATVATTSRVWREPNWSALVPELELTGLNRQLANNCAFIRRRENTVQLGLDRRSESYLTRDRQAAIAEALSRHFGERLNVDIEVVDTDIETPVVEAARRNDERQAAARAGLEADPNVRALQDMFGAKLVPDSVTPIERGAERRQE